MWYLIASCSWFGSGKSVLDEPASPAPSRPQPRTPGAIPLTRSTGTFTLPASDRPNGEAAPDAIALLAPFVFHDGKNKADVYRTPLPMLPNLLPSSSGGTHQFGSKEPVGFKLLGPDGPVAFARNAHQTDTYGFDEQYLYLGVEKGAPPPDASKYSITFSRATHTENGLNLATSGLQPDAFAKRTMTIGTTSWSGLYLPAPAEARFTLTVPDRGRLGFDARILAPALRSMEVSDGATVEVAVVADGQESVLDSVDVDTVSDSQVRVDLAKWSGRQVDLVLRTRPGATSTFDYVLLESPMVYTPRDDPQRIVLVFIDTLRQDHLHYNGYERQTSPTLDKLARHAAVFSDARSVAPWTLPSTRAVLTGHQPEDWFDSKPLPEILGDQGWRTDAVVSNAFLSQPFDMERGWDRYEFEHLEEADEVVATGIARLSAHEDQDQLLMVHFMEPHLPFDEPLLYQRVWAGSMPDGLKTLSRTEIASFRSGNRQFPKVRQYVIDRYDQEILAVDHALGPLFEAAGAGATVVLFSDHGEELWDHDGFEHGHTFYDELLRVPLAIRSPNLPEGKVDAPVSLLDVAPTVCELAGTTCADGPGRSLVALAWGDAGQADQFGARPQAFGRPLYGNDGWGVIDQDHKWWDRSGVQALYALTADPREKINMATGAPDLSHWPEVLATTLGRDVRLVWRVELPMVQWQASDLVLAVSSPVGIERAWLAYSPRGVLANRPQVIDGQVQLVIPQATLPPEAVYVLPVGDPYDSTGLVVSLTGAGAHLVGVGNGERAVPSFDPKPILQTGEPRFEIKVELQWVPTPSGVEVAGFDPQMAEQLRELGYVGSDE